MVTGNPPEASLPPTTSQPGGTSLPRAFASISIAYTDEGRLWVWENGQVRSLTRVDTRTVLSFSNNGREIAFTRDGQLLVIENSGVSERVVIDADNMNVITSGDQENQVVFTWLPDNEALLVSSRDDSDLIPTHRQDLYLVNADTGEILTLFHAGEGGLAYPSPDGDWIAVASEERILLMKSDGSRASTVLVYNPTKSGGLPYIPRLSWGEDSRSLLAEIMSEESMTIWRIPVQGTAWAELTTSSYKGLSFSPDHSKFAYVLEKGDLVDSPVELHIADLDGSDDETVYSAVKTDYSGIAFRSWSPDSGSVLFTDINDEIQWMDIEDKSVLTIPEGPSLSAETTTDLWINASCVVIARQTPDAIWLSVTGEVSLQVVRFKSTDLLINGLSYSFAFVPDIQTSP